MRNSVDLQASNLNALTLSSRFVQMNEARKRTRSGSEVVSILFFVDGRFTAFLEVKQMYHINVDMVSELCQNYSEQLADWLIPTSFT